MPREDHPRLRGVDASALYGVRPACGSSPLTRGRPGGDARAALRWRIIPAYAGSTEDEKRTCNKRWDHPRLRGVDGMPSARATKCPGSSPLTRGRRGLRGRESWLLRIIPAYAGSTCVENLSFAPGQDHPRLRGVDTTTNHPEEDDMGSSPLTRGRLASSGQLNKRVGIIPAYAGSTTQEALETLLAADHPRLRGVDHGGDDLLRINAGSSPLTRGRLFAQLVGLIAGGIIPAYAGSTGAPFGSATIRPDHPRLRGVDGTGLLSAGNNSGSSPLTRGRQANAVAGVHHWGIIPAYAGSTLAYVAHGAK